MPQKLEVPSYGWLGKLVDWLMIPIMYLTSGTLQEAPQQTHRWNNYKLSREDIWILNRDLMVKTQAMPDALPKKFLLFHIPILGGWRDYIVLKPEEDVEWYPGWITPHAFGVSKLRIKGPVRLLLGPSEFEFFGINANNAEQLQLKELGAGRIGSNGPFSQLPLL